MKNNNRNLTILLISLLSVIAVLLLALLIFLVSSNGNFVSLLPKSSATAFDESYAADDIDYVFIESDYGNINFCKSNDENIRICVAKNDVGDVTVQNQDGKLIVKNQGRNISGLSWLGRKNINCDIDIYLPDKELEKLTVKSSCGNVEADTIAVKIFAAELDYGNIEIDSFNGSADVQTDCGNIEFSTMHLTAPSKMKSNMGNIEVENIGNVSIIGETSLGECKINDNVPASSITLNAQTDMGNIEINQ